MGQAEGRWVLLLSLVNNGSNVLLNYGLIVGLGWASTGAGLATGLSQWAMATVGIILVLKQFPPLQSSPTQYSSTQWSQIKGQIWQWQAVRSTLALNRDILIRTLTLLLVMASFTNLSARLETVILAANSLLLQVVSLGSYFIDGFAFALEGLVGQLQGQGKSSQMTKLLGLSCLLGLICGLLLALGFNLWPRFLFGLLTNHGTVLEEINGYRLWLFPVLGFGSIAFILDGYFIGLTAGRVLRRSALFTAFLGFTPLAIWAWWHQSSHLLWLAFGVFMLARVVTLGSQIRSTFKI